MPSNTSKEAAARLVEDVLSGVTHSRGEFNQRVAEMSVEPHSVLALEIHQVGHYLDDADIRERDPEYAEAQTRALREILAWLRTEA